jgi:hypothetical protein
VKKPTLAQESGGSKGRREVKEEKETATGRESREMGAPRPRGVEQAWIWWARLEQSGALATLMEGWVLMEGVMLLVEGMVLVVGRAVGGGASAGGW